MIFNLIHVGFSGFYFVQHATKLTVILDLIFVIIGLLFAFLGNYFKTIKPNYFIGIKTPWTLENEEVWKKTHLIGGKLWFIGGLLMALTFVLPNKMQFYTFMGITAVIKYCSNCIFVFRIQKNQKSVTKSYISY